MFLRSRRPIWSASAPAEAAVWPAVFALLRRTFRRAARRREHARQRHALLRLDDRLLRDVGLTRAEVEAEAGRPFWHR